MNAVIYARVSSERQAEKDTPIEAQIKELKNYASKHNYNIVDVFVDKAKSAMSSNRPAFQEMITLAKQKDPPFDAILVWKLSRFARNREDSVLYKSLLKKKGIQVISINEQIDSTPAGKMLEGILEVVDEFYSNNLASDTMRGMKENASRGFYCGGSIPYGYKLKEVNINGVKKKIFDVDVNKSQILKKIFNMSLKGEGAKDIAKYLNENYPSSRIWKNKTVLSILHNEIYTGSFIWNKKAKRNSENTIKVPNCHKEIISKKDFDKVQRLISKRSPRVIHPKSVSTKNLLNGLIHCSTCNKLFTSYSAKSGKFHYYVCQNKHISGNNICSQKPLNIGKFDSFIVEVIKDKILTPENITELVKLVNSELGILKKELNSKVDYLSNEISDKKKRLDKLFDTLETTELDLSDIAPRIKKLSSDIDSLEKEKDSLEKRLSEREIPELTQDEIEPYVTDLQNTLKLGTITEQKSFIRSFVEKIWIDYPTATIEYTLPLNELNNSKEEVLVIGNSGWGERIRTRINLP